MRVHAVILGVWVCMLGACSSPLGGGDRGAGPSPQLDAVLRFSGAGAVDKSPTKGELLAEIPAVVVSGFDPNYQHNKRFSALPLAAVMRHGFPGVAIAAEDFVLRALDGYTVPMPGARLLDAAAFLAVSDLDAANWEPVGPRQVRPGPFYVIWQGPERLDTKEYPRPWGVVAIERARFADLYPHTVPPAGTGAAAQRGFTLFSGECIHCHAINREGGQLGPDLNVPRSIVEYRPVEQVREFIRNPLSFRYSAMPAHPQLSDADLDGLIAYFQVMRLHKHDPDAKNAAPARPPSPADGGGP